MNDSNKSDILSKFVDFANACEFGFLNPQE